MITNHFAYVASPAICSPLKKNQIIEPSVKTPKRGLIESKSAQTFFSISTSLCMLFFVGLSFLGYSQVKTGNTFSEKGLELAAEYSLTEEQTQAILAFNFEEYRKEHNAVFIAVLNGPTLVLHSLDQMNGIVPDQEGDEHEEVESAAAGHDHHEIEEGKGPYKRMEIITVEVF